MDRGHGDPAWLRRLLERVQADDRLDPDDRDELLERVERDLWLAEHFEQLPEDDELAEGESLIIFGGQFVQNPDRRD